MRSFPMLLTRCARVWDSFYIVTWKSKGNMSKVIVSSKPDEYKQEIIAGTHVIYSDAPEEVGGKLAGPDPHELLLASLGACTSITLQMFAKKRGWDLQQVCVTLSEEKVDDPSEPT